MTQSYDTELDMGRINPRVGLSRASVSRPWRDEAHYHINVIYRDFYSLAHTKLTPTSFYTQTIVSFFYPIWVSRVGSYKDKTLKNTEGGGKFFRSVGLSRARKKLSASWGLCLLTILLKILPMDHGATPQTPAIGSRSALFIAPHVMSSIPTPTILKRPQFLNTKYTGNT